MVQKGINLKSFNIDTKYVFKCQIPIVLECSF